VWVHRTSLTPSLFIEVPLPSQESDQLGVSILSLSTIFLLDLGTFSTGILLLRVYIEDMTFYARETAIMTSLKRFPKDTKNALFHST
jgi:hypothetical protein